MTTIKLDLNYTQKHSQAEKTVGTNSVQYIFTQIPKLTNIANSLLAKQCGLKRPITSNAGVH